MKVCVRCGGAEFYKNRHCKACSKGYSIKYRAENTEKVKESVATWKSNNRERSNAIQKKYVEKHPERVKERDLEYRLKNRKKANERSLKWRQANPERVKQAFIKWRKENPSYSRVARHNRRARKLKNGGKLSRGIARRLYVLQRGKCPACNVVLLEKYHLDHIHPISRGGANEDCNVQLLCPSCNTKKHAKHPVDFMQERGFLL